MVEPFQPHAHGARSLAEANQTDALNDAVARFKVLTVITKAGESRAKKNEGKRCRNGQAPWSVVCGWDFRKSGYGQYLVRKKKVSVVGQNTKLRD